VTPLNGRRVAVISSGLFLLILLPNLVLAVTAVRTFSGLVVPNSYVASQEFDRVKAAQEALGWRIALAHVDDALRLDLADPAGRAVHPPTLTVTVGRPTTTRDDRALAMEPTPTGYAGEAPLAPGNWRVEIAATAEDGTRFHQSRDIFVRRR
jgi:nitrogen fixation protein FixH